MEVPSCRTPPRSASMITRSRQAADRLQGDPPSKPDRFNGAVALGLGHLSHRRLGHSISYDFCRLAGRVPRPSLRARRRKGSASVARPPDEGFDAVLRQSPIADLETQSPMSAATVVWAVYLVFRALIRTL